MASWPPLSQTFNYLLASQSIVWYLLRKITDTDTSNYRWYRHRYHTDTGIGQPLLFMLALSYTAAAILHSLAHETS